MQAENKFMINKIKWKPRVSLDLGLQISVDWYKKFIQNNFHEK